MAGRWLMAAGAATIALVAGLAPAEARVFVGFGFGVPVYAPPPPVVYYAPPPVVYTPAPVVVQPGPAPAQSWYYCDSQRGYYPYVANCPGGWRAVPATPPAAGR